MPTYLFLRRLRRSPAAFSGLALVILLVLTALFAPWLAPHDPNWQDAAARLQGPGAGHWLGTDSYGRDLLSRLLYGARPALGLVALVTAITLPVGLLVGILSGYYGGWLERILMRFTDVVMSMPRLILAFAFVAMLAHGELWVLHGTVNSVIQLVIHPLVSSVETLVDIRSGGTELTTRP